MTGWVCSAKLGTVRTYARTRPVVGVVHIWRVADSAGRFSCDRHHMCKR